MENGEAVVSWLEAVDDAVVIMLRHINKRGEPSAVAQVAITSRARASGFPRMVNSGGEIYIAWTDVSGELSTIRTRILRLK